MTFRLSDNKTKAGAPPNIYLALFSFFSPNLFSSYWQPNAPYWLPGVDDTYVIVTMSPPGPPPTSWQPPWPALHGSQLCHPLLLWCRQQHRKWQDKHVIPRSRYIHIFQESDIPAFLGPSLSRSRAIKTTTRRPLATWWVMTQEQVMFYTLDGRCLG